MISYLRIACVMMVSAEAKRVSRSRHVSVKIGDAVYNVTNFGAKCDGVTDDTQAIQDAFDACTESDGGTVLIPKDLNCLSFALQFASNNTELQVDGTLTVNDDREMYYNVSGERDFLVADGLSDLAITGAGTVDGQGQVWWENDDAFWPKLVSVKGKCHRLLVTNTTFKNSPNHNLELDATYTEVAGVTILAPPSTGIPDANRSHNTDAVDVHGEFTYVHDCYFSVGDDNVAIHANNTLIEQCNFGTGHGASIGSLCDVWLTNITVRNITFNGTTDGARVKTHPNCSGKLWDVLYENLTMHGVEHPLVIDMYYGDSGNQGTTTMRLENLTFSYIVGEDVVEDGTFDCHQDSPCYDLSVRHVHLRREDDDNQWYCDNDGAPCCQNVASYDVYDVQPAGLTDCFKHSMNSCHQFSCDGTPGVAAVATAS